ncbi:hypothetical protein F4810DRAFT_666842 [Camillea tinctor]|nr:hypothetical protein F4810DRAFT_666842 [Camillea tinctor]
MYQTPSSNSTWILEKGGGEWGDGLRLYHPVFRCYLATSFRTYIDYDGDAGNDTVKQAISRISEAVCTRGVSRSASLLGIVEGNPQHCLQKDSVPLLQRGWLLAQATVDLYRWRRQYSVTLELPDPFTKNHESGTVLSVEEVVVGGFLVLHLIRTLCRRRRWLVRRKPSALREATLFVSAVHVWSHVAVYWCFGVTRWGGSLLVVGLSLVGIQEMLLEL